MFCIRFKILWDSWVSPNCYKRGLKRGYFTSNISNLNIKTLDSVTTVCVAASAVIVILCAINKRICGWSVVPHYVGRRLISRFASLPLRSKVPPLKSRPKGGMRSVDTFWNDGAHFGGDDFWCWRYYTSVVIEAEPELAIVARDSAAIWSVRGATERITKQEWPLPADHRNYKGNSRSALRESHYYLITGWFHSHDIRAKPIESILLRSFLGHSLRFFSAF